jgi:hypothetical protein
MNDFCSIEGANELAERIRRYWLQRGYVIKTAIMECGGYAGQAGAWCVRTDLVGGMPRKVLTR